MKNHKPSTPTDEHTGLIVEFKPWEIAKQFDVNINMDDFTPLAPIPTCPPVI